MYKNRTIILLAVIFCQAWTMIVPIYSKVFDHMVLMTNNNLNISQLIISCTYFISAFILSFIVGFHNVKKMMAIGVFASVAFSTAMWFLPVTQTYYIAYALLGIAAAAVSIPTCHLVVYSFTWETRVKSTAIFLFGYNGIIYLSYRLLSIMQPSYVLILANIMQLSVILLIRHISIEEAPFSSASGQNSYPYKLILCLALVIFITYFNGGLINNIISKDLEKEFSTAVSDMQWMASLMPLLVYLFFCFVHTRTNFFILLYSSLIFFGVGYILYIIPFKEYNLIYIMIQLATGLFDVFIFSFVGYISLKHGKDFSVFRWVLFAVAFGSIAGELLSRVLKEWLTKSNGLSFAAPLLTLFASFLIMPWLAKYINDEVKKSDMKKEREYPPDIVSSTIISDSSELKEKLFYANSLIMEGSRLTPRELEIAELLLERYDIETIAQRLFISRNTLKVHISRIYHKFQVSKKKELIERIQSINWEPGSINREI